MPLRKAFGRAIGLIESELSIVQMELEHPERFIEFPTDTPPLARCNGHIAELLEYLIPLQLSGKILKPSGEPMNYTDLVRFIESIFGVTIKKAHDIRIRLLTRKKSVTPFIDKMRVKMREEAEKSHL